MSADTEAAAASRLEASLSAHGLRDFRQAYRKLLVQLRELDEPAYEEAVDRYRRDLLPELAREGTDPVDIWLRYGMEIAGRVVPGRAVSIDASGRSTEVDDSPPPGALVLHLPDDGGRPAIVLAGPSDPSGPQEATVELLVR